MFCFIFYSSQKCKCRWQTSALLVIVALVFLGVSELFIDLIALSEITSVKDKKDTGFLAASYMLFTGSVARFIGAKVADLAAFQGTPSNLDLIKQAQLFQGLFTNIMAILTVTIILCGISSFCSQRN